MSKPSLTQPSTNEKDSLNIQEQLFESAVSRNIIHAKLIAKPLLSST